MGLEGRPGNKRRSITQPGSLSGRKHGVEEFLSDYQGRIALLNFRATWCAPCIAALPQLRDMVAKLPPDRFTLLAISEDDELGTVTEFIEEEPMPWTNWHTGNVRSRANRAKTRSYSFSSTQRTAPM